MSCPYTNPTNPAQEGPVLPGEGDTDYERYMRVPELLRLQKPDEDLVHHDERMFQTIHQSFELWANLVLHELHEVGRRLDDGCILEALPLLDRAAFILDHTRNSLQVLDTMHPLDFHVIRAHLGTGSGAESPGFRRILREGPTLWPKVLRLLDRHGTSVSQVYLEPTRHPLMLRLLEGFMNVDHRFHDWRLVHLGLVKRQIGAGVKSLKGLAVKQLEHDAQGVLWPELWQVRDEVTQAAGTSPP